MAILRQVAHRLHVDKHTGLKTDTQKYAGEDGGKSQASGPKTVFIQNHKMWHFANTSYLTDCFSVVYFGGPRISGTQPYIS